MIQNDFLIFAAVLIIKHLRLHANGLDESSAPNGAKREEVLGRFPFNKNHRLKFSEFSLVEWNASDRFPEFEVMCSATQCIGDFVVFFENFRGLRAA